MDEVCLRTVYVLFEKWIYVCPKRKGKDQLEKEWMSRYPNNLGS